MIAKDDLSVPASSPPIERLFNTATKVFISQRCRLNDRIFEQLMTLCCTNQLNVNNKLDIFNTICDSMLIAVIDSRKVAKHYILITVLAVLVLY